MRVLRPEDVDVLVLAGDIAPAAKCLQPALRKFAEKYREVVYVPGNHEYYGGSKELVQEIREWMTSRFSNFHWLENDVWIHGKQRFLGTTLWFEDSPIARIHRGFLADYTYIQKFEPWVYEQNEIAEDFLQQEMQEDDVVITHHLPSYQSVAPRYKGSRLNCYFVSDVELLIHQKKPRLWLHGHTHDPCNYWIDKTQIICNPLGYPIEIENAGDYNDHLIINVGGLP